MSFYDDVFYKYMTEANAYAEKFGLDKNSKHNGEWDAYTSAAMTRDYGEAVASAAGWANEVRGDFQHNQPIEEKNMDLWNNNVGREIGKTGGSSDELAQKIFEELNKGTLIINPDNDTREYSYSSDEVQYSQFGDEERILTEMTINSYNASTARYDPLILDLNGDGVKTISQQTSKTFFDLSGDGMSEQTGWVDSNDGLLVYDKNANGKIDDINELFGNANQSGFSELKQLFDANSDNLISDKDINFSSLKVWQDINSDGISQENELKTLNELGITSINLNSSSTNIDSNGNTIKATSTFTQNGEIKQVADVDFTSSKMLTNYTQDYTLTIDALIRGYGTVKDAHVLYSIDESFAESTKDLNSFIKFIKYINNSFYKANFEMVS